MSSIATCSRGTASSKRRKAAPVIDLMAALKRSLAREVSGSKHTAPKKANKMAPDQRQPALLLPTFDFDGPRCPASFCVEPHQTVPTSRGADQFPKFVGLTAGESWIRTFGSATEKLPLGAPCGFRERLHQLEEVLIPRGTKSSNPASSRRESRELLVREFLPSRSGGVVQRTIVGQAPCSCARASGPHRVLRARQTERTAGLPLGWRRVNPSAELMVDPGQVRGARSGTRVPL